MQIKDFADPHFLLTVDESLVDDFFESASKSEIEFVVKLLQTAKEEVDLVIIDKQVDEMSEFCSIISELNRINKK